MRRLLFIAIGIAGCAAPPLPPPAGEPIPFRLVLQTHRSISAREAGPILDLAAPVLERFVAAVTIHTEPGLRSPPPRSGDAVSRGEDNLSPLALAVIDRARGRRQSWNLRLYTPEGALIFEDTAGPIPAGREARGGAASETAALAEIGASLQRSRRVRSYAAHGTVFPPDVLLRRRQDSILEGSRGGE